MTGNKDVLGVLAFLIICVTCVAFAVIGIYALQHGFIKTGGWLVFGAIAALFCFRVKVSDNDKQEAKDENK